MSGRTKAGRWAGGGRVRATVFSFIRRTPERLSGDAKEARKWDPLVGARGADTPRRWL